MDSPITAVDIQWHEFDPNILCNEYGLKPFYALDNAVKRGGGSRYGSFTDETGEKWTVTLSYRDSGLAVPESDHYLADEFQLEEMREYQLRVAAANDDVGKRDFTAHIAPRWPGLKSESGKEVNSPESFGEGINMRCQGSNINAHRYHDLLVHAFDAVGVKGHYIRDAHSFCNVQDAAVYVRLHKNASGPLHARDGPIASMAHVLENDRDGYRKLVQDEIDETGANLPGYYHTVTLDPHRLQTMFPDHKMPKEVKHYYWKYASQRDADDPLAHPKLEVAYQASRWDETVYLDDLDELERELKQTLLAVLADAGLTIQAGDDGDGGPWVPDEYWKPRDVEYDFVVPNLNLASIQTDQEHVVVKHLANGLSPVQWESLTTLITDGGQVSPQTIANEHGRHYDSVTRALRDMEELVERKYGEVSLRSTYVAELVHQAVEEAQQATRRAVEASAKAMDAAERGLDEKTSAFVAWCASHGVTVDDRRDAQLKIRLGEFESAALARRALRAAESLWVDAKMDVARFRNATVHYQVDGTHRVVNAWQLRG